MKPRQANQTLQRLMSDKGLAVLVACFCLFSAFKGFSNAAVVKLSKPALQINIVPPTGGTAGHPGGFSHIQVNDSFGARDMLRTAKRLIASGHLTQAVRNYQHIALKYGSSVIEQPDGTYESVRKHVWARLLSTPAVQQGLYNQIYGLKAQQVIQQAAQSHSLFALTSACERYFATDAAGKALQFVAARQFERGRFALAARLWMQLLKHPALVSQRPVFMHNAAIAAWLAGEKHLAGKLLTELAKTAPHATGMIAGKSVHLLADARAILGHPSPFHRAISEGSWPTFEGNFRRNGVALRGTLPAAVMWTKPLNTFAQNHSENAASVQYQNELRQFLPAFGLTVDPATGKTSGDVLFSFPTCRKGTLYVNLQDRIKAVDINSGYTLWQYPHGPLPASSATANLATLINELDHYSCTLNNGKLYTVLARPGGPRQIPTQFGIASANMEIVCLNAATGALQWKISAANLLPSETGRIIWPACIPLADHHGVFLVVAASQPGTGMNELSLVRLSARTGTVQWRHYLCTITGPAYGVSPFNTINIIPAMADNMLYISTGLGADMAINADSGQVQWLRLNEVAYTPFTNMQYGIVRRIAPWRMNAPVVSGSRLITMDSGFGSASHIHVYNRWTGAKLLSLPCRSLHHADMLLGAIHGTMILAGRRLCAVNIQTGKQLWASAPIQPYGTISGRPFLTRKDIYLPLTTGLLLVNTDDGSISAMARWPAGNTDSAGNLLVTAHEIVVVNDNLAAGYARWKDALAYLSGRIKAHPKAPEPYLTLAEVAFRSNHNALAQRMLGRAVTLAKPTAATVPTVADRIFRVCMTFALNSSNKSGAADAELFYLQKASFIARRPDQQVQWRMAMARYYLAAKHPARAMTLLEQILAHGPLRAAAVDYRGATLAASTAARSMIQLDIIKTFGTGVYAPWEQLAQKLLAQARNEKTSTPLQQIVLQYPNSAAALQAAQLLSEHFAARREWARAYDMLLWTRFDASHSKSDRAWQLSRLCSALAHLRHWNQALVLATRGAEDFGSYRWKARQEWTFAQYAQHIRQTAASLDHRAVLNASIGSHLAVSGALHGDLLQPLEHAPRYRRYSLFLLGNRVSGGYEISARRIAGLKPMWNHVIADARRAMLVGYRKKQAILATNSQILAINAGTGQVQWDQHLLSTARHPGFLAPVANAPMPAMQRMMMIQNGMMINGGPPGYNVISPNLAAQWREALIQRDIGASAYRLIKMLPAGIFVAGPHDLMLYNPQNGKPAWKKPVELQKYGTIAFVRQTRRYIAVAIDLPIEHVVLISRRNGRVAGVLPTNPADHFYWMQSDPAGRLLLCGQTGAAMYDPTISISAPVWSRNGLHDAFPTAACLTVDGLITPTATGMACMDITSGAIRWNQPGLNAGLTSNTMIWMQTALNHNTLVMLTPRNLMAISTRTGDIAWKAEFVMQTRPPLTSAQIGDPDIVAMAQGPLGPTPNIMHLYLINQKDRQGRLDNGSIVIDQQLTRSNSDPEAPEIQSWLLVNGGILFEVNGVVFYCHT